MSEASDHQRQDRVLGAGSPYDAIQFLTTDDTRSDPTIPLFDESEFILLRDGQTCPAAFRGVQSWRAASLVFFSRGLFLRLAAGEVGPRRFGEALTACGFA